MAANIDQTLGMKLDADFQNALNQLTQLASKLQTLQTNLSNAFSATKRINNFANQLQKLNKMDVDKLQSQLTKVSQQMSKFNDQMKKVDTSGIDRVSASLKTLIENARTAYQSMQKVTSSTGSGSKKSGSQFTGAEKVNSAVQQQASSIRQQTALAYNGAERLEKKAHSLAQTLKRAFTVGNVIYFWNMMKSIGQSFSNILMKPIDFAETENLFTAAFGRMRDEAYRFGEDLSEAFGLALPDILQMEATFKNMLGSLGGLAEETSTQLSATMTKMTIDFASLYNVSIESASQKMQSALSRQVRPIRSVSGYDITQNVLGGTAEDIGITDRSIRDMTEMEKRLLIIITLQNQMARSSALGDFANTIESSANQLKILQQQISETGRWLGSVFMGTIGKILPYINGFVMAIQEIIKSLAFFVGYELPDTGDIDRNILDSMGDGVDSVNSGLEETNDQLDDAKKKTKEWKNFLASFDVANVIPDQSSEDSDSGSSSGSGGVASDYIDPRILAALKDYDNLMYSVQMKAHDIRDTILDAMNKLGTLVNDHIFKPITSSWNEYGEPIINNLRKAGSNIEYILGGAVAIVAARWDEAFQQISDTFFSFVDTASLIASTVTEFFKYIWDFGGAILFNSIISLVESLGKLAQAINDDFIKPVIRTANDVLVPVFGGAIGTVAGIIGTLIEVIARLISKFSEIKPAVIVISAAFAGLYSAIKITQFLRFIDACGGMRGAISKLNTTLAGHSKIYGKVVDSLSKLKIRMVGSADVAKTTTGVFDTLRKTYENLNNKLKLTSAWQFLSTKIAAASVAMTIFGASLKASDSAFKSMIGTLITKLGSLFAIVAAHPFAALATVLGVVIGLFAAFGQTAGDTKVKIEDCSQAVQDQSERIKNLGESMEQANQSYQDSLTQAVADASAVEMAIRTLNDLADEKGFIDNENLAQAETLVGKVNDALGETYSISEDNRLVQKKTNEEIQKSVELMKEKAKEEAKYQLYTEYQKNYLETAVELNRTQKQLNDYQEEFNALKEKRDELYAKSNLVGITQDEKEELQALNWQMDELSKNLDGTSQNMEEAESKMKDARDQLIMLGFSADDVDEVLKDLSDSTGELSDTTAQLGHDYENTKKKMLGSVKKYNKELTEADEEMYDQLFDSLNNYGTRVDSFTTDQYASMISAAKQYGLNLDNQLINTYAMAISRLKEYGVDVSNEQQLQHMARLISAANSGDTEGKKFVQWLKQGTASDDIDDEVYQIMKKAGIVVDRNKPLVKFATETAKAARDKLAKVLPKNMSVEVQVKAILDSVAQNVAKLAANVIKIGFGKYAEGGFPNVGQMFIARESGPELVGTMRGRTAVANNYQIEEGIYRAVKAAMSSVSGVTRGGDLYITIQNEDGTKIEKVIKNYNDYITRNGGKGGFIV